MATDLQPPGKRSPNFGNLPRDEWVLRMHRSALASAAYHANSEDVHRGAPYPLKPLALHEIVAHFDRHPNAVMREHTAAWLLDHPGRAHAFAPYIDRLVGVAAADLARAALAQHGDGELDRTVLWRPSKADDMDQLDARQSRFAVARGVLAHARNGTPPSGPTTPTGGGGPAGSGGGGGAGQPVAPSDAEEATEPNKPSAPRPKQSQGPALPGRPLGAARLFGPRSVGAGQLVPVPAQTSEFHCRVRFDAQTQITRCNANVLVDRPASDYDVVADPQNWSVAAYLFFQKSQRCTFADGGFPALVNPPPAGSVPFSGALHEVVSFSFNPFFPLSGDNVLQANFQKPGPLGEASRLDVSLGVCLSTAIGLSLAEGGLDVDAGFFSATQLSPAPSTRIAGSKVARFTSRELCGWDLGPWLNLFAPLWIAPFLGFMIYESASATE
jgi:hypothetical protein